MKKIILLLAISLLTLSLSAQFTANMLFTLSGKQMNFKVLSDENRYRYEFNEDGQEGVVIVLNNSKEVFILMPKQKMAIKSTSTSQMSMSTDPLKIYEYYLEQGGIEKTVGNETVNGYKCAKKELYNENNQLLHTLWFSEKYNFPIKIVSHIDITGNTQMELKDIKPWTPEENKFKIPEGYMIMDQTTMMPQH